MSMAKACLGGGTASRALLLDLSFRLALVYPSNEFELWTSKSSAPCTHIIQVSGDVVEVKR